MLLALKEAMAQPLLAVVSSSLDPELLDHYLPPHYFLLGEGL